MVATESSEHNSVVALMNDPFFTKYNEENMKVLVADEARYMPKTDFLATIQESYIEPYMRRAILEWLFDVALEFTLESQIVSRAANYFDRYLSVIRVNRRNLQVLALAALTLAAKVDRSGAAHPTLLLTIDGITAMDVWFAERSILETLSWDMGCITPHMVIVRLLAGRGVTSRETFGTSVVLADLTVIDYRFHDTLPTVRAGAAVATAVDDRITEDILNQLYRAGVGRADVESGKKRLRRAVDAFKLEQKRGTESSETAS